MSRRSGGDGWRRAMGESYSFLRCSAVLHNDYSVLKRVSYVLANVGFQLFALATDRKEQTKKEIETVSSLISVMLNAV